MQLARFVKVALVSSVVAAMSTEAFALDATATTDLNIRLGPGRDYAAIDTLYRGEVVNVTGCQANGWCTVTRNGPDGWVSGKYLTEVNYTGSTASSESTSSDDAAAAAAFIAILGIGAIMIGSAMNADNPPPKTPTQHWPHTTRHPAWPPVNSTYPTYPTYPRPNPWARR